MLERVNKELPEAIKKPLIIGLKTRPTHLFHLFLLILLIVAIFRFWDQGFSSFRYNNEEIRLRYHNRLKPVVLNKSEIQNISLDKSSKTQKYSLVIKCTDGKIYRSNSIRLKPDDSEIREICLKLNTIYGKKSIP
jgi:hypothetical protein